MKVVEYLIKKLLEENVTDIFGIPGGVVLDFIKETIETNGINAHLSYHEQASAFEACGYAQLNNSLGVAYATKGPGFTNLVTGIAEAYSESIPVLFITSHSNSYSISDLRFENEQELDTLSMVKKITKFSAFIDNPNNAKSLIDKAIFEALSGRKGPVFLDISSYIWAKDIIIDSFNKEINLPKIAEFDELFIELNKAKRPIILVGDGIRQSCEYKDTIDFINKIGVPVLSSRCSQDIGNNLQNYFGYIGSHGLRYSNFILSKSDYILCLGNRMAFPDKSKTFNDVLSNKVIYRIEIDENECNRTIKNTNSICMNLVDFVRIMNNKKNIVHSNFENWISKCSEIKKELFNYDCNDAVVEIVKVLKMFDNETTIVADVGNNEFWLSRAYEYNSSTNRILYSKTFGALGCSIPKSIGAYFNNKKPVLCFVGDQGFQYNMQELKIIENLNLPILIVIINNYVSGMIRDRQMDKYKCCFHTTSETGYSQPNFKMIASAYNIKYYNSIDEYDNILPAIIDLSINSEIKLSPHIKFGDNCNKMSPYIDEEIFEKLNEM